MNQIEVRECFVSGSLSIGLASTDRDKKEAWQFVYDQSMLVYKCAPQQTPQHLFAARTDSKIIGTVGLDFCGKEKIGLEVHHQFNTHDTPWPIQRKTLAIYSAWRVSAPTVAQLLVYISSRFAKEHGKTHGLCELKPSAIRRLQQLKVTAKPVKNSKLLLNEIPTHEKAYYETDPPELCMVDFGQICCALESIYPNSKPLQAR